MNLVAPLPLPPMDDRLALPRSLSNCTALFCWGVVARLLLAQTLSPSVQTGLAEGGRRLSSRSCLRRLPPSSLRSPLLWRACPPPSWCPCALPAPLLWRACPPPSWCSSFWGLAGSGLAVVWAESASAFGRNPPHPHRRLPAPAPPLALLISPEREEGDFVGVLCVLDFLFGGPVGVVVGPRLPRPRLR